MERGDCDVFYAAPSGWKVIISLKTIIILPDIQTVAPYAQSIENSLVSRLPSFWTSKALHYLQVKVRRCLPVSTHILDARKVIATQLIECIVIEEIIGTQYAHSKCQDKPAAV